MGCEFKIFFEKMLENAVFYLIRGGFCDKISLENFKE